MKGTVGDDNNEVEFCLEGLNNCICGSRRRDIDDRRIGSGSLFGLETTLEDGEAEMGGSCLFGIDSSHHLGAVVKGLLGLEGALSERRFT